MIKQAKHQNKQFYSKNRKFFCEQKKRAQNSQSQTIVKKQIFKQKYTQNCWINVNIVKRINEKRYLINCINLQLKQKKICW